MIQRWVFTQSELARIGQTDFKPYGFYEFVASLPEGVAELGVIVYRNGTVSNRWEDGTVGIPKDIAELADDEETLYTMDGSDEYADEWRDVHTNDLGEFLGFVTPA